MKALSVGKKWPPASELWPVCSFAASYFLSLAYFPIWETRILKARQVSLLIHNLHCSFS